MWNIFTINVKQQRLKITIRKTVFENARKLFNSESYLQSLKMLEKYFQEFDAINYKGEDTVDIRDAIILQSWNLQQLQRYDDCLRWINESIKFGYIDNHDPEIKLITLWIDWARGDYEQVFKETNVLVEEFSQKFSPLLAEFLFLRGVVSDNLGVINSAIEDCEAAYTIFRIVKKPKEQAIAANYIGVLLWKKSQYSHSLNWLERSISVNKNLDFPKRLGVNYLNIGIAFYKLGKYNDSKISILKSLEILLPNYYTSSHCRAKIALGNVCRLRCEYTEARKHLMRAYTIASEQRMPREECLSLEFLGDVFRDEGKPQEALRYYARGKAIAEEIAPEGDLVMELWRREGECLLLMDDVAQAMPILARARSLACRLGDRFEEGVIHRCQAACAAKISDWESAGKYIQKSIDLLEEIEARHELAISYLQAANICSARAKDAKQKTKPHILLEEAWNNGLAAQHIFLKLGIEEWLERAKHTISSIAKQRVAEARHRPVEVAGESFAPPENMILAVSMAMRNVLQMCDAFAGHDEAVLITGETGTGKELIARRLHEMSNRRRKPFVALNAAAIPANMFEREFFGHHKGAFTGAEHDQHGYAAEADGGTLFLDEIAELPLELQPKLLRLLQEGTYLALGSPDLKRADVRLLAATNANLKQLVDQGKFRQDLFYRLRILEIEIPPLRERPEDIVPLLNHFLSKSAGRQATVSEYFDEVSIQAMMRHGWEGNVREIAMTARRAHISMAAEGRVRIELGWPPNVVWLTGPEGMARAAVAGAADRDVFRSRILVLLEETGGNRSETARRLGISRPTLYRWMKRFGIKS